MVTGWDIVMVTGWDSDGAGAGCRRRDGGLKGPPTPPSRS